MSLTDAVRQAITRRNLSARKVGQLAGVPHDAVSRLRKGLDIKSSSLDAIAEALQIRAIDPNWDPTADVDKVVRGVAPYLSRTEQVQMAHRELIERGAPIKNVELARAFRVSPSTITNDLRALRRGRREGRRRP
jgi:transcriptional regulator with XRE-family HTH domain